MSLEQAVLAYRNEYLLGNNFRRLKGPLSMRPFHLQREDRMAGMAHLLTIALRVMTLIEFAVRQSLQQQDEPLREVCRGSPNRETGRPTTERLLQAFRGINLIGIPQGRKMQWWLTPLSDTQTRILALLGLSNEIHLRLQSKALVAQLL